MAIATDKGKTPPICNDCRFIKTCKLDKRGRKTKCAYKVLE